ncbi:uncharacterized protein LOC133201845 isoform X2 [Saccostrea echinata]|uniref:uncharacterized protein LOC133201845 isoform X2 n=1 Tax=Saccostrea echinata TaxID=191078 RepID=UPI002A80BEBF|nr:uncharacterized protein LOC133201845 isoform X2 [Saccostrea echinata]
MEDDLSEGKIGNFEGGTITLNLEDATQLILQQQGLQGGALPPGTYQILTQDGIQISDNSLTITDDGLAQILGVERAENLSEQSMSNSVGEVTGANVLDTTSSDVQNGSGEVTEAHGESVPLVEDSSTATGGENSLEQNETATRAEGQTEKEETEQQKPLNAISWETKDFTSPESPETVQNKTSQILLENIEKTASSGDRDVSTIQPTTGPTIPSNQPIKDLHVIIEQEAPPTPDTPTSGTSLDLSKPIEVTNETIVIIDGKKCVLSANPDTGQLCAYPVLPSEGKRKRGRPPNSSRKNVGMVPPAKKAKKRDPVLMETYMEQTNAAEGLLELSNTGPDGVRRSGRSRKKARLLDDYEVTEVGSDEEVLHVKEEKDEDTEFSLPGIKKLKTDSNEVNPVVLTTTMTSKNFLSPTGVKRGRGRPRRYPPPGQSNIPTQIPAVIIPGANGPTIMMAPVQGISNMNALAEQIKSLPTIVTKVVSPVAPKPTTSGVVTVQMGAKGTQSTSEIATSSSIIQTSISEQKPSVTVMDTGLSGDPNLTTSSSVVLSSIVTSQSTSNVDTLSLSQSVSDNIPSETLPTITMESDDLDNKDQLSLSMSVTEDETLDLDETVDSSDQINDEKEDDIKQDSEDLPKADILKPVDDPDQQTIIRIPENLIQMFLPKKDPVKLGLKLKFNDQELQNMKCPKCDFQAYYPQQYQSHIATHPEEIQKCKCCNFVSFDPENLLAHFKENHPRCICNVCNFMAEHAYIIKRHMMRHNMEGCTCHTCGKVYKDQYILKMHVKMVHMPAEVLFECTVCSKKFTRKAHLKRHLRIHEPEKPYKCPHCDYRGCEKSDISKHILIHEEPKHVCDVCGKAFRHIKNKELHLKRHNGQKDYKCGVCEFYGYTFTDIRKHIERKHSDVKSHVCEKCGSIFKTDPLLKEHLKNGCEIFMIEQALAIATSTGGTSQATIQIPSNSMGVDNEFISKQDNSGPVNITVEQVTLGEAITLSEEHLQAGLRDGSLSIPDTQVIESGSLDEGQVEVISHGHIIEEGQVIESGDGVMSEEEENDEGVEEEEGMIAMEHLSGSVVEEDLSVGEGLNMQMT